MSDIQGYEHVLGGLSGCPSRQQRMLHVGGQREKVNASLTCT
jgi:hypothetical protein